jgi:hypothetical protein
MSHTRQRTTCKHEYRDILLVYHEVSDLCENLFQDSHINTSIDHKTLYFQYIAHIIKMLINQFCSLKYFHATYFGPLRTSSGVFKPTVFTFTTTL